MNQKQATTKKFFIHIIKVWINCVIFSFIPRYFKDQKKICFDGMPCHSSVSNLLLTSIVIATLAVITYIAIRKISLPLSFYILTYFKKGPHRFAGGIYMLLGAIVCVASLPKIENQMLAWRHSIAPVIGIVEILIGFLIAYFGLVFKDLLTQKSKSRWPAIFYLIGLFLFTTLTVGMVANNITQELFFSFLFWSGFIILSSILLLLEIYVRIFGIK